MRNRETKAASADLVIAGIGAAAIAFGLAGQGDSAVTFLFAFLGLIVLRVVAGARVQLLPLAVALAAITAIGAIGAIGDARVWSPVAHFVGGLFVGMVLLPFARGGPDRPRPPAGRLLVLVAMVLSLGVVWELGEMAADAVLRTNPSPSLADTGLDLAADAAGAAAAALLSYPASRAGAFPTGSPPR